MSVYDSSLRGHPVKRRAMSRWEKMLLVALPLALLLSVACRFIHHTDLEYAYWIDLYGDSVKWLEARCAELDTPGACGTAQDRRKFVASLESYRQQVLAWWWPALIATVLAWLATLVPLFAIAWRFLRERR